MKPFICFSVNDARKHFPGFDRKRLSQWQKKGFIERVVREYYLFSEIEKQTMLWWYVANKIFEPSYISLQTALSFYGFIPEAVFQVTSITTKKTRRLENSHIRFIYRNIKSSNFFGYSLKEFREGHVIRIAEPEKALLDLLYLENKILLESDIETLRLNKISVIEKIDQTKMDKYALTMDNKEFLKRYDKFKSWLNA